MTDTSHQTITIDETAILPDDLGGKRLDQALAKLFPQYSRSLLTQWIKAEQVSVNGQTTVKPTVKMRGGESIRVKATSPHHTAHTAEPIALDVVHEDNDILVINKPAGLVVHPAIGHPHGTLLNGLLHHCPHLAELPRAGIVHRLDKLTTGLLVIAKTLPAHTALVDALQKRLIHREYRAIVSPALISGGTIDAPIGRHPTQRTHMAVVKNGKPAITHYRIIERFRDYTYIQVVLETGRTHQIRVHMTHIRHPIVGDPTYGGRLRFPKGASAALQETLQKFHRQALHAYRLSLDHPATGETCSFTVPIPDDMQQLLVCLREENPTGL